MVITDEIYEHIVYEGEHVRMATLPGMRERTVTINVGVEDVLRHRLARRLGARAARRSRPHPQGPRLPDRRRGGAAAGGGRRRARACRPSYYATSRPGYRGAARTLVPALEAAGFRVWQPAGAYYVMTDIAGSRTR